MPILSFFVFKKGKKFKKFTLFCEFLQIYGIFAKISLRSKFDFIILFNHLSLLKFCI